MTKPEATTNANAGAAKVIWQYSRSASVLHWTLALLIAATAVVGRSMMSVAHQPSGESYFSLYTAGSQVIATLVIGRIAWRLRNDPDRLPAFVPLWQVRWSAAAQMMFYSRPLAISAPRRPKRARKCSALSHCTGPCSTMPGQTNSLAWIS